MPFFVFFRSARSSALVLFSLSAFLVSACQSKSNIPAVYHEGMKFDQTPKMVLLVSFDGLRPDAIDEASADHLQSVRQAGVSANSAHTILPALTLPSHTSMLTGVSPEKHGVLWNSWEPQRGTVTVPTLFDELKRSGLTTAMIATKEKFRHLDHAGSIDRVSIETGSPESVASAAIKAIEEQKPQFLFLHFGQGDSAGHKHGWMSDEQLDSYADVDQALGSIFQYLESKNLLASTAVIATSDHGGEGHTHGGNTEASTSIPWIAIGAGIPEQKSLRGSITTYDTAATVAKLLNVEIPVNWDGKSVF